MILIQNHKDSNHKINSYKIWKRILNKKLNLSSIINDLTISNLQTRGGFNFISSLTAIDRNSSEQKYIVCNAEEGEPGTFKERDIMLHETEALIEGIAIAGYIIGATVGYIYIRGEFKEQFVKIEQALNYAYINKLLGKNLLDSNINFDLYALHGAGGYICGEFTAMLESIEGKKSFPRIKPPLPSTAGLYGCPTAVINTETLASIPIILEHGGDWYLKLGKVSTGGCKIFSVSGHITNPGNYEVPMGTNFIDLLTMAGGVKNGKQLKAVLPGGLSSPVLPANIIMKLSLDYASLAAAGSTLGSGGIIIMDETTCMVEILTRITKFYMDESCGQCSPCREGTGWMYRVVNRILANNGSLQDLEILDNIANNISGKNICALGDMAALSVTSFIKYFRDEFINKIIAGSKVYDNS